MYRLGEWLDVLGKLRERKGEDRNNQAIIKS